MNSSSSTYSCTPHNYSVDLQGYGRYQLSLQGAYNLEIVKGHVYKNSNTRQNAIKSPSKKGEAHNQLERKLYGENSPSSEC